MDAKTWRISVQGTGKEFACGEGEFLLEAMTRSGQGPVHHGCFGGGCGVCKMRIVSGEYRVEKKMSRAHVSPQEEEDGIVLLCCAKPCGDLWIARVE